MDDYIKPGEQVEVSNIHPTLDEELWCVQDTKLYPRILLMNEKHPPLICNISNIRKIAMAG